MQTLEVLEKLEAQREASGLSRAEVQRRANLSGTTVGRWLSGTRKPTSAALSRYRHAIRSHARGLSPVDGLILNIWDVMIVLVAREHGVEPSTVRNFNPQLRATRDPDWVAKQRVRWEALYLMHNVFGFKHAQLAQLLGVTRQSVQTAGKKLEAARDGDLDTDIALNPVLDARLSRLMHDLTETD